MSLLDKRLGTATKVARKRRRVARALPSAAVAPPQNQPAPFDMPQIELPRFPRHVEQITQHGAVPDDQTDSGPAIAAAIEACSQAGGGRVLIPAGKWFTGPIHLRSNIELHLAEGATLRFSNDPTKYLPAVFVRWGGVECYNYSPLIYACNCKNIAITGRGTILGQGSQWWEWKKAERQSAVQLYQMVRQGVRVEHRRFASRATPMRPPLLAPINCSDVLLEDFTIAEAGPAWSLHLAYCRNVVVRRVNINAVEGPNTTGIVVDSCRGVMLEDCRINTGSDCIALKSGLNEDGWRVGKPTENVLIRRIHATGGTGGFAIGSELSGDIRNVLVHDCRFDDLTAGIRIKAARGRGGIVENIHVHDVAMGNIPGDVIQVTTEQASFSSPDGKAPILRNIHIRNLTCEQATCAGRVVGLADAPFRDITLEKVTITADQGLYCAAGNGLSLVDVRITPRSGPVFAVKDTQDVLVDGLNNVSQASVFLDLRGRQTRNIRLRGQDIASIRPTVVLGIDVPKDAIVHE